MADFTRAINFVLRHEGGYVNDPNDPGGETNFGISKRAHPEVDIANLTATKAAEIYKRDYWKRVRGDDLPDCTALALLDWTVHSGDHAVRAAQTRVGTLRDGILGPVTLAAIQAMTDTPDRDRDFAEKLCMDRALFAGRWIARKPAERGKFAPGFMVRLVDLVAAFTEEDI